MIYFDNAATSCPKPNCVINAVNEALVKECANSGRAGHDAAQSVARLVYDTREKAAKFFGVNAPENVVFTQNCTAALNSVIKGLSGEKSHFIISSLEHNAVLRPLEYLKEKGKCTYSIAVVKDDDFETVMNFDKLINENTVAIICTGASNVFGKILPIKKLSQLAHSRNIYLVVDAAQTAGILDINCENDGIDFLCVAGHKGLYAPMAIGMMINNCGKVLDTLIQGGTGNNSFEPYQPTESPERYESGTLSVPLIAGLGAGIDFVNRLKRERIFRHEKVLMEYMYSELRQMPEIVLYTDWLSKKESFVPLLSFNIKGLSSEATAQQLNAQGIAVRAGFHCAPLAHFSYKTDDIGTVRVAPSVFTEKKDVNLLLNSVFKIAKSKLV